MNAFKAVAYKQLLDTVKNPVILIIFLMFPAMSIIFSFIFTEQELKSVLSNFMVMHLVMTPIIATSSIVSEESEKGTLRFFIMKGVSPLEYLFGIGSVILIFVILCFMPFVALLIYNKWFTLTVRFFLVMALTALTSMILGFVIALVAKSQIKSAPVSMILSFLLGLLPMFSLLNDNIENVSKFIYSSLIHKIALDSTYIFNGQEITVIMLSLLTLVLVFICVYKTSKSFE